MFLGHFGVGFGAKAAAPKHPGPRVGGAFAMVVVSWGFWIDKHRGTACQG